MPAYLWTALGVVAATAFIYGFYRLLRVQPLGNASDEQREEWYTYLLTDPNVSGINSATVATFVLGEAKYILGQKSDAIKSYEGKAAAQLSIVGGGIGLLSVFGANQPAFGSNALLPLLVGAGICLLSSISLNLVCIAIGDTDRLPTIDVYNYQKTLANDALQGRIIATLTESYVAFYAELTAACRTKKRIQRTATMLFGAGVVFLVANYGSMALHPALGKAGVRCDILGTSVTCKEQPEAGQRDRKTTAR